MQYPAFCDSRIKQLERKNSSRAQIPPFPSVWIILHRLVINQIPLTSFCLSKEFREEHQGGSLSLRPKHPCPPTKKHIQQTSNYAQVIQKAPVLRGDLNADLSCPTYGCPDNLSNLHLSGFLLPFSSLASVNCSAAKLTHLFHHYVTSDFLHPIKSLCEFLVDLLHYSQVQHKLLVLTFKVSFCPPLPPFHPPALLPTTIQKPPGHSVHSALCPLPPL